MAEGGGWLVIGNHHRLLTGICMVTIIGSRPRNGGCTHRIGCGKRFIIAAYTNYGGYGAVIGSSSIGYAYCCIAETGIGKLWYICGAGNNRVIGIIYRESISPVMFNSRTVGISPCVADGATTTVKSIGTGFVLFGCAGRKNFAAISGYGRQGNSGGSGCCGATNCAAAVGR